MPSLNVELPRYVIVKRRAIKQAFYFQVPKRLRPDGWAGAYRLPFESLRRSGLADPAEIAAVTADANALYDRLRAERKGEIGYRLNTLPWLIQSFDQKLKKRKKPVPKNTMRNYAYAARQVLAWSLESGHPHVRLIDRPAILAFLETMDETPRKKLLVAA